MSSMQFCAQCGQPVDGAYRFCGACGAPALSALTYEAAAPLAESTAAQGQGGGFGGTDPWQRGSAGPGVPGQRPGSPESGGGTAPGVKHWTARHGVTVERFASGDWIGALLAGVAGVVALVVASLLLLLLVGAGGSDGHLVAVTAMAAALAVGGTVDYVTAGIDSQATLTFQPLLVTGFGYALIAAVFLYRVRRSRLWGFVDVVLQAVRVWVVLLVLLLVVSLVGRVKVSDGSAQSDQIFSSGDHVTTAVLPTLVFGSAWLVATLLLAVGWRLPESLPPRVRRWRSELAGPTAGAISTVVLAVGLVVTVVVLAAVVESFTATPSLATGGDSSSFDPSPGLVTSSVLVFAPALLLGAVPFFLGTPLSAGSFASFFGLSGGKTTSVTVLDATDDSSWLWFAPVVALVLVVLGGVVCALHAPTPHDARRTGWRMGVTLGLLFLLIAVSTAGVFNGVVSFGSYNIDYHPNYAIAPLVGLVWGSLGGWVGAPLAPRFPKPVIADVRDRVERTRVRSWSTPPPPDGHRPPAATATGRWS